MKKQPPKKTCGKILLLIAFILLSLALLQDILIEYEVNYLIVVRALGNFILLFLIVFIFGSLIRLATKKNYGYWIGLVIVLILDVFLILGRVN